MRTVSNYIPENVFEISRNFTNIAGYELYAVREIFLKLI